MRNNLIYLSLCILFLFSYCSNNGEGSNSSPQWASPMPGTSINLGDSLSLQLILSETADSVLFFADGIKIGKTLAEASLKIPSTHLSLGIKTIDAKVYRGSSDPEELSTNIVLKSTLVPQKMKYSLQATFNHDTSSYTQGLEFHNGFLYESGGLTGESSLRKTEVSSGRVLQLTKMSDDIFAEGITIIGDKIFMLTYRNAINLEFDLNSLKLIRQFPVQYQREGWGLCNDGKVIYSTDGTNSIYVLNKDSYMQERAIEVYDHNGPVNELNELEFIDGMIYANIYGSSRIVIIDPKTGQVKAEVDLSDLYPDSSRSMKDFDGFVLNGIAWDSKGKRLFVTGKKWDKLFQIKLSPQE
jgi:glutamine cyclotransferase